MTDYLKIAQEKDATDPLKMLRQHFVFPKRPDGKDLLYFAGNSLGLKPKKVREYITHEFDDWEKFGVEGHFQAKNPWFSYHEFVTESLARLVGAKPIEVVAMNSLTVNLHLMMVSFYKPTKQRHKILMESGAFPSDQYAIKSQIKFHGFDPKSSLIELRPRAGEDLLREEDIFEAIEKAGDELALVLFGNVNYLTGQYYNIPAITNAAHKVGSKVAFDLAHGVGNLHLKLHDDGPDFAVWCHYKYVNAGPGAIAGCFVHERHAKSFELPRFSGWWGHNKQTRFKMSDQFEPIEGAEGWQLSNPPIFQLAALRAALEIFDEAQMSRLKKKSDELTTFLEDLLKNFSEIEIITPKNTWERGTQLSLRLKNHTRELLSTLAKAGVVCDFREPNIMRVAPVPLYTKFEDLVHFKEVLDSCLKS